MLPNGLVVALDLAVAGTDDAPAVSSDARARYAAYLLGIFREDVVILPFGVRALPSPSRGHIYPRSRGYIGPLYARAVEVGRRARLRGAYLLGRAMHVLVDMACPVHALGVLHFLRDPFERYVDTHADELAALPVPGPPPDDAPEALVEHLASAARRFRGDDTQSPWGRALRHLGLRRPLARNEVAAQARTLLPLAAAHLRALLARYTKDLACP